MKRNLIAVLCFLVSLATASCSKSVFFNGKPVTESRSIGHFSAISMFNNVNVTLVESDRPHLELTCPENLIDNITTELSPTGDTLIIKNENKFNWLRSYDYSIDLTVYFDSLREINFASNGNLVCTDSLRGIKCLQTDTIIDGNDTTYQESFPKMFNLNIHEGSGDIDLTVNSEVVKCSFGNGTSLATLRGVSSYTEINMRSYGAVHAEELVSNFVRVQSFSTNDAYVWAKTGLRAWLYSIGNVYYKGNPAVTPECYSDGRVIKMQ